MENFPIKGCLGLRLLKEETLDVVVSAADHDGELLPRVDVSDRWNSKRQILVHIEVLSMHVYNIIEVVRHSSPFLHGGFGSHDTLVPPVDLHGVCIHNLSMKSLSHIQREF